MTREDDPKKPDKISETWMRTILDNIEEIIHILDWKGRFIYLSPSWERVTGFPIKDTVGNIFTPYAHPDDVPHCLEFLNKVHETGQPHKLLQFRVKHASGKWIWFTNSGVAIKDENGKPIYFLGLGADITERKRIEESLADREQRLRTIIDSTEEVIFTMDLEGNFLFISTAWEHTTGHTVEETVGKNFALYVHEDDFSPCINFLRKVVQTGEAQKRIEFRVKSNSGKWIWFSSTGSAIKDPHGTPQQYVGAAMDITERKRIEEQRLEHERQMQQVQKLESLGVLAGGIAHDFNNILLAILGNADLAMLELPPTSSPGKNLSKIKSAAERAADLCRQMLAYAGKGLTVIEEIDLEKIIREMHHFLETSISKKIRLQLSLKPDLPLMKGDGIQIRQIILNLITNGSEAIGSSEGVITIETGVEETLPRKIPGNFTAHPDHTGPWILLKITDSGCGMDSLTTERVFEPFFTTKFTGRGLGMSAVQGIVRSHHGHITVESAPGRGTCFRLLFPVFIPQKNQAEKESTPSARLGNQSRRILLVDDEQEVLTVCTSMLKKLGHEVITASDGKDALTVFIKSAASIDLIILDLTMPRMDGKETLKELRLLDNAIPVVISSGYTEIDISEKFSGIRLNGFIQKPYTLKKLAKSINNIIETNI